MKKLFTILGLLLAASTFANTPPSSTDLSFKEIKNLLKNPGFELGRLGWTKSGSGTFSLVTASPSTAESGTTYVTVTPAATNDSWSSDAVAVPGGWSGKICSMIAQIKGGDLLTNLEVYDGSNVISSVAIGTHTTWGLVEQTFNCPASGTLLLRTRSTSSSAVVYSIDTTYLGLYYKQVTGMAGSNDISRSSDFTLTGFGTPTEVDIWVARDGNHAKIQGHFLMGTATAVTASMNLPSDLKYDTTLTTSTGTSGRKMCNFYFTPNAGPSLLYSSNFGAMGFYDGADNSKIFITTSVGTNAFTKSNGNSFSNSNSRVYFDCDYPVAGWDANVVITPSTTYKMGAYLQNGTRVTGSAPTALGQYRSYLRNISALTYTETNGTPTTLPTAADGFKIYAGHGWGSPDPSNQPSSYDIFVGKNKLPRLDCWNSTGHSGALNYVYNAVSGSSFIRGMTQAYDASTGVFSVTQPVLTSTATNQFVGSDTAYATDYSTGFCEITVSDNALAVGMDSLQIQSLQKNERLDRAYITGVGTANVCTADPCTISSQTGTFLSAANWSTTGTYVLHFNTAYSSAPSCFYSCSNSNANTLIGTIVSPTTTTQAAVNCQNTSTGGNTNARIDVMCMGPK